MTLKLSLVTRQHERQHWVCVCVWVHVYAAVKRGMLASLSVKNDAICQESVRGPAGAEGAAGQRPAFQV